MSFNTDGFNERRIYVQNENNVRQKRHNFDNSFAKMRSEERRDLVKTTNQDQVNVVQEVRGSKDNFIVRNNAINNVNHKSIPNNPVMNAMNKNMFRK